MRLSAAVPVLCYLLQSAYNKQGTDSGSCERGASPLSKPHQADHPWSSPQLPRPPPSPPPAGPHALPTIHVSH